MVKGGKFVAMWRRMVMIGDGIMVSYGGRL